MTRPYVSPIYEVRAFDGSLSLTVRYEDDEPGIIELVQDGGRVTIGSTELGATIDALRRIQRDWRRDEREMERKP